MTTIHFHRSGGIVGSVIEFEVNLNELPVDESQRLTQLISESDFFNIPDDLDAQVTPDEFQYVITVESGQSRHTVHVTDTTMPLNLIPLIKELTVLQAIH